LDALAFAGGVLPDATLCGMQMFRSHGGTVLTVAGRDPRANTKRTGKYGERGEREETLFMEGGVMRVVYVWRERVRMHG